MQEAVPRQRTNPYSFHPVRNAAGDSKKGYTYLTTGDYLKSGIPYSYFLLGFGKNKNNYLQRDSPNADISHEYTAVKAANGELVVAPNCLQCHAQVFDNKLIIGLGNSLIDFSDRRRLNPRNAMLTEAMLKKGDSRQYEAAEPFLRAMKVISGQLYTEVRGVNPADRLADLLVAHRDPLTFHWTDQPVIDVPQGVIPTDVPRLVAAEKEACHVLQRLWPGRFRALPDGIEFINGERYIGSQGGG